MMQDIHTVTKKH